MTLTEAYIVCVMPIIVLLVVVTARMSMERV